jgi:hypothetical protein
MDKKTPLQQPLVFVANLSKELTIGAHVYNPTRAKLADYDNERVPTIMKLGLDYKFSNKVFLAIETEKDINYSPVVKVGVEYHAVEMLYLRGRYFYQSNHEFVWFWSKIKRFQIRYLFVVSSNIGFNTKCVFNLR